MSQKGRLLLSQRDYTEAIKDIERTIDINLLLKDTLNAVYNYLLLGGAFLRAQMYKEAKQIFTESIVLAKSLAPRHMAKSRMYLAAVQYGLGEIDSALILIHNIPQEVDTIDKVSAMAYAAQIYQDAGMPDSAYIYAIGVLNDSSKLHHEIAYSVLLSPELQPVVV